MLPILSELFLELPEWKLGQELNFEVCFAVAQEDPTNN